MKVLIDAGKDFVQDPLFPSPPSIYPLLCLLSYATVSFHLIHIFIESATFRSWLCEGVSDDKFLPHKVQGFVFSFQETIKIEILVYQGMVDFFPLQHCFTVFDLGFHSFLDLCEFP